MDTLENFWKSERPSLFTGHTGLILSCSGGLDSSVLFHLVHKHLKFDSKFPLKLLHFNFGLRGEESDGDQAFVESLAKDHGVELLVRKLMSSEIEQRSERNIQAWARSVRMQTFKELAKEGWIIGLAHQKDDLAENVLLRMTRGVGPGSLLGMKEWNAPFWRPLLNIGREELRNWLSRHKLPHRHDSTNDKMVYSRNAIRHRVLPELRRLNPKARDHIVRCAQETQDFVEFTRASLQLEKNNDERSMLGKETFEPLPKGIAYDLISCAIGRPEGKGINHKLLEQALEAMSRSNTRKSGVLAQLPEGKFLVQEEGAIAVVSHRPQKEKPRFRQHSAALIPEARAIILGPSALADFFPLPAGSVLDQKVQVRNSDHVVKKFNGF